ncbi:autotransporter domain-containing protein [Caulobacter rhizosphaerae]|jgi:outer membrane autotransporter protein|uniref:autotransporter domain-containing protein n=1 Tax=Caulobacter rhizosphaerae TaxID=2010972 RepID=UPI0013D47509|nr:autotransporter domain-containing protein [Caulobacter rhizosphaerae]GGL29525.1 hypothetical protein GCM10010983_28500 [Caulobacter rhizosphaerae]
MPNAISRTDPAVPPAPRRRRFLLTTALTAPLLLAALDARAGVEIAGSVTPSPATSPTWTVPGTLTVGDTGSGSMTVTEGGVVTSGAGVIGQGGGGEATATVVVDGAGSRWDVSNGLTVGMITPGALTVSQGGAVASDSVLVGYRLQDGARLLVDGAGSSLTTNQLTVGLIGDGVGVVRNGGGLLTAQSTVGVGAFGQGSAVMAVSGAGSHWANTGDLIVGREASGEVVIDQGASLTSGRTLLGVMQRGRGVVRVIGTGSTWENTGGLQVGVEGVGVGLGGEGGLEVLDGGHVVTQGDTVAGLQARALGTLTVSGPDSSWINRGALVLGQDGRGYLRINGGGMVETGDTIVGLNSGANGLQPGTSTGDGQPNISVSGVGARLTMGDLVLGAAGHGSMSLEAHTSTVAESAILGRDVGGVGRIAVIGPGASFDVAGALTIGQSGRGDLIVGEGGEVTVGAGQGDVYVGDGGGSGGVTVGWLSGSEARAPGALKAARLIFGATAGSVDNRLDFNHSGANYVFSAAMSGVATIRHQAGETIFTGDSRLFGGVTLLNGGTLQVDGALGGTLSVLGDGRLRGSGSVGTLSVAGVVAPGASIGTLTVSGAYAQLSGSIYELELTSAGASDRILVGGAATIAPGSILQVTRTDPGPYRPGTRYTVLSAADGVTGTYTLTGDVANPSYFLGLRAAYDANNVYLDVVQSRSFASVGATANQSAVGAALDGLPASSALAAAALMLPDETSAQVALDQLAGTGRASAKAVLVADSRFPRQAALARLRDGGEGAAVWGDVFGTRGAFDGGDEATTLKRDLGGVLFGIDAPIGGWRLGVLAGYGRSDAKARDRSYATESDDYHLGVYGGRATGPLAFRAGAALAWHDLSARRAVAFSGFSDTLVSEGDARTAQAFGEVGYRIPAGTFGKGAATLEPFAALAYVSLDADGAAETGGGAALTSLDDKTNVTFATLGAHLASDFDLGPGRALTGRGTLAWRHASGDVDPTATAAFTAGGPAFTVTGLPIEKDALVVEVGLSAEVSARVRLSLSYDGQFADKSTDQSLRGGVSLRF